MVKVNDIAPDFETVDESGNQVKLSDFRGKKVVLYWYVKDNTKGCQAQSCSLRDNYDVFTGSDVVVLGIAPGTERTHKSFREKNDLPFPLLMDEDNAIARKYGVWQKKKMYGREYMGIERTTFLIDEEGKVEGIFSKLKDVGASEKVKTKEHASQVIDFWGLKL